ncbi:MAG: arginyl-tRNA synthetase [Gammaproteobacteria bacterium]|jgi:arginyl-tRNA synthetase
MKELIKQNLVTALNQYIKVNSLHLEEFPSIEIEHVKDLQHGDFASNIAMILAKPLSKPPRIIAEELIKFLSDHPMLEKTEIAGPGFINFFLAKNAYLQIIPEIFIMGKNFGTSKFGNNKRILLEYVSSNPTGPIHIGHGRGAAYGSVLAQLLLATGHNVTREYYVNDAGRQMDILATSVWLRYLQIQTDQGIPFPENGYHGQYITDIAQGLYSQKTIFSLPEINELLTTLHSDIDEDKKLDKIISQAKSTLKNEYKEVLFPAALDQILAEIKIDLENFGVCFDNWFSERSLIDSGEIDRCISKLESTGAIYEKDGAKWFNSSEFGDEKDRVVVRENGMTTYFASDIAYHINKYDRGYDEIINIWGADHHGYISRVNGALTAFGKNPDKLKVLLVQFATLYKGKEKLQMSTRSGEYVTLKQLRDDVGNDATRFFYLMRKAEQHLDFDLELAKSESNVNPVYYIQYAHARICSVFKQLEERGLIFDSEQGLKNLSKLDTEQEQHLVKSLSRYGEIVHSAAINFEPHQLSFYLRDLATDFHGYYNSSQFIVDDDELRSARFCLISATRQVLNNGLDLLGLTAPEEM